MSREPVEIYMEGPHRYVEKLYPHARVNLTKRPWPVDPREYPFSAASPTRPSNWFVRALRALRDHYARIWGEVEDCDI